MTPFHYHSIHQLPPSLFPFLDPFSLAMLSCTNRTVHHQVQQAVLERKQHVFENIIPYFYYYYPSRTTGGTISLLRCYDNVYSYHVRLLFHFLPELFQYIEQHIITTLSMEINYMGQNETHIKRLLSSDTMHSIATELLHLLSQNKTLEYCNFGTFYHVMEHDAVEKAVHQHPTILYVSLYPITSTRSIRSPPSSIWRHHTRGTFYWSHFREDE